MPGFRPHRTLSAVLLSIATAASPQAVAAEQGADIEQFLLEDGREIVGREVGRNADGTVKIEVLHNGSPMGSISVAVELITSRAIVADQPAAAGPVTEREAAFVRQLELLSLPEIRVLRYWEVQTARHYFRLQTAGLQQQALSAHRLKVRWERDELQREASDSRRAQRLLAEKNDLFNAITQRLTTYESVIIPAIITDLINAQVALQQHVATMPAASLDEWLSVGGLEADATWGWTTANHLTSDPATTLARLEQAVPSLRTNLEVRTVVERAIRRTNSPDDATTTATTMPPVSEAVVSADLRDQTLAELRRFTSESRPAIQQLSRANLQEARKWERVMDAYADWAESGAWVEREEHVGNLGETRLMRTRTNPAATTLERHLRRYMSLLDSAMEGMEHALAALETLDAALNTAALHEFLRDPNAIDQIDEHQINLASEYADAFAVVAELAAIIDHAAWIPERVQRINRSMSAILEH